MSRQNEVSQTQTTLSCKNCTQSEYKLYNVTHLTRVNPSMPNTFKAHYPHRCTSDQNVRG